MGFWGDLGKGIATGGLYTLGDAMDITGKKGIQKGMDAQQQATAQANAVLKQMYDQQRADFAPWQQAGTTALSQMGNPDFQRDFTADDFQKDPGYDFRMQQGQQALERSAAARGGLNSGATLKALARYGQDFASNEYNNAYTRFNADRDRRFGRLSSIAGLGANAVNGMANAAGAYGGTMSQNLTGLGNAMAGGHIAQANAMQNLVKTGLEVGARAYGGA